MVEDGSNISPDAPQTEAHLDSALTGALPCIGCGYDLQGLSVRSQCPECGLAVRATILYCVDPHADAFQPLSRPGLTAAGLRLWSISALLAAISVLLLRLTDLLNRFQMLDLSHAMVSFLPPAFAALSAVGALALIRPVNAATRVQSALASLGALAYIPLVLLLMELHVDFDALRSQPYFGADPQPDRIALRMAIGAIVILILLCLRPNARQLVARSLVLRTGRVDRQTMIASAAAVAITMFGDLVRLCSIWIGGADTLHLDLVGSAIVLIGSLFVILALLGAMLDTLRVAQAVLAPSPGLRTVFGDASD